MAKIHLPILLIFLIVLGCQNQPQPATQAVSLEIFNTGPQLVKIPIKNTAAADSLIHRGMDVIVVEENYVIAKLDRQQATTVQTMSLPMETFTPEELVQRLIRIVMKDTVGLQQLGDIGIDIWEVKGDTVVAQAFDKYIRQIQTRGFEVEIVEKNIQNLTHKK